MHPQLKLAFVACLGAAFGLAPRAFAGGLKHDYYNTTRPYFGANTYITQKVQYVRTDAKVQTRAARDATEREQLALIPSGSTRYEGYSLTTSLGFESFRFLQTGLFYSNVQQSSQSDRSLELRGHEAGAEAKLVFNSPVTNVHLIGGSFLESTDHVSGRSRLPLTGHGSFGGVDFAFSMSPSITLLLTGRRDGRTLSDRSRTQLVRGATTQSTRIGAGLSIWL